MRPEDVQPAYLPVDTHNRRTVSESESHVAGSYLEERQITWIPALSHADRQCLSTRAPECWLSGHAIGEAVGNGSTR